jgi:very-long-chain (3R)-3-hydroxyacyl-CoA dehydratase
VRASPLTTAIQVVGKNLVVWTVMRQFPGLFVGHTSEAEAGRTGFIGCILAWGASEVIRYGYFVILLATKTAPKSLLWLRYGSSNPRYYSLNSKSY